MLEIKYNNNNNNNKGKNYRMGEMYLFQARSGHIFAVQLFKNIGLVKWFLAFESATCSTVMLFFIKDTNYTLVALVLESSWIITAPRVCLIQLVTHHCLEIVRTEFSLWRQHLDREWVCFGKLQDPPVAEEVAAAHSSTQQPVSRQKVNWIHNERREAYYSPGSNSLSEGIRFGGSHEEGEENRKWLNE